MPEVSPPPKVPRVKSGQRDQRVKQRVLKKKCVHYHKTEISQDGVTVRDLIKKAESKKAAEQLTIALDIRTKYQDQVSCTNQASEGRFVQPGTSYGMVDGVVHFEGEMLQEIPYSMYVADFDMVCKAVECGPTKSVCRDRLKIIDEKYAIYIALNSDLEENQCSLRKGGGIFSGCVKIDNSVRLSTAMHSHNLLDYMINAFETEPHTVVGQSNGKPVTLRDVFTKYGIDNPRALTVEGIGLHPPVQKRFHRFDIFSKDFNRGGERSAELLKLFLKRDGPLYHNLVRPVLERTEKEFETRRVATEYKLPIFGTSRSEWTALAKWVNEGVGHFKRNKWIIQIPRIAALRCTFSVATNQDQLDNIFLPMWEATINPDDPENKELATLLTEVGALNVISDESTRGQTLPQHRPPADWPWAENPPDLYFNYYVWANIVKINHVRRRNGLNTFTFRPNCGEAGYVNQVVMGFMLAQSINHGITMERSTVLQYLFYLSQAGIVLSPLASNGLGNPEYLDNPFPKYQKRGMRVSLGTEDPLHYHHSTHPCIEEYGTASKIFKLGPVDMTEIARNSVLNSGFSHELKQDWLGVDYNIEKQAEGNDASRSYVPDVRLHYRSDTLAHERAVLKEFLFGEQQCPPPESRKPSATLSRHPSQRSMSVTSQVGSKSSFESTIVFPRVDIIAPLREVADEDALKAHSNAATMLADATALRLKYIDLRPELDSFLDLSHSKDSKENEFKVAHDWEFIPKQGVYMYKKKAEKTDVFEPQDMRSLETYWRDFNTVHDVVENIYVKGLCHRRLQVLEHKFALHMALNMQLENQTEEGGQSRDFYQAAKVDTHIHAAAGMTARQLLEFILKKAVSGLDDIVKVDENKNPVTLKQLLSGMGICAENLTVHTLNVQADATLFERFDNFNNKYNPMGNPDLRNLLLKTDNYMGGRYFAEIAKMTFAQFARDEYTYAEMRLSIYGRSIGEWAKLATWFDTHGMANLHNTWMVQIPRIYSVFRQHSTVSSFQQLLTNVFEPLWKVSINPASDAKLHHFLKHMSGFDSVDNESQPDLAFPHTTYPTEWTSHDNPPYGYWMYFMWANIRSLNTFRKSRGLSTFQFRPHCGESGSPDHLIHAHLTADQINHGVNLRRDPALEYLYYLSQMGIAVSPLSNNSLFLDILKNPFPLFFRRGLNVSLSTDDPLQFHYTQEPLIEEYSIASKVWKFNANDMCEIARNSVIQCGFPVNVKSNLVGHDYLLSSSAGNDPIKTHLSNIRVAYRFEAYHAEIESMEEAAGRPIFEGLRAKYTLDQELDIIREKAQRRKTSLKTYEDLLTHDTMGIDDTDLARAYLEKLVLENEELKDRVFSLEQEKEKEKEKEMEKGKESPKPSARNAALVPKPLGFIANQQENDPLPAIPAQQYPVDRPRAVVKSPTAESSAPFDKSESMSLSYKGLRDSVRESEMLRDITPHVMPHPPVLQWGAPVAEQWVESPPKAASRPMLPRPHTGQMVSRRINEDNSYASTFSNPRKAGGGPPLGHPSGASTARSLPQQGMYQGGKVPPPPPR